jgi:pyruvate/2-oxoglutarate dehydrogenase complex dihydrolipoamide dehydrogenase (E3) component
LGGTSFHRGYYGVRAFRACAEILRQSSGLAAQQPHSGQELVEWLATQARVTTRLVSKLQAELKSSGVDVRFGRGSLLDANTIRVQSDSGQTELVRADHLILATGSRPDVGGERLRRLVQQ